MNTTNKNQTFVYIYALCIIMVIDGHSGTRIGILSNIFPYDSFFMPLFVFSSGYFYHHKLLKNIILRKARRLLVPYFVFDLVMVLFVSRMTDFLFRTSWHRSITIGSIVSSLFEKPTTPINSPAWFVVMLFWVSISYALIRNVLPLFTFYDYLLVLVFCIAGALSIYICINYPNAESIKWRIIRFICRTLFYIQYYHLGYMFKKYFETALKKQSRYLICSFCILINVVLVLLFGNKLNFYSTFYMKSFNSIILPLITSVTGIVFYYEIASFLSKTIGENQTVSFIARNTFVILQVHMLFANIPNYYIYYIIRHGSHKYNDFPVDTLVNGIWARYNPNTNLIGFFCGIIGSLLVAYSIEKIRLIARSISSKQQTVS